LKFRSQVASAAFFGSFIGGALGSLPVLLKEKSPVPNIILAGSVMAYSGEVSLHVFFVCQSGRPAREMAFPLWTFKATIPSNLGTPP